MPTLTPAAQRLYTALGPFTQTDAATGYTLAQLCAALAQPIADVETYSADTDAGDGWTPLLDVTRCPTNGLPFLAQMVGAVLPPGATDTQARTVIRNSPGLQRGTAAAIAGAAQVWLTPPATVLLTERYGGNAYALLVQVYTAEVVDTAQLTAAVKAAVPAGILLTLTFLAGWTYAQMVTHFAGHSYAYLTANQAGQTYATFSRETP